VWVYFDFPGLGNGGASARGDLLYCANSVLNTAFKHLVSSFSNAQIHVHNRKNVACALLVDPPPSDGIH
jgi:hypothetical protein